MTISVPTIIVADNLSHVVWRDLSVTTADPTPDAAIYLNMYIGGSAAQIALVVVPSKTMRFAVSQIPQFFALLGMKSDQQKAYFSLNVDIINQVSLVVRYGSSGGGDGVSLLDAGGSNTCRAMLGYRNLISTSSAFIFDEDANYPFALCYDYKTNTEFSPVFESETTTVIDLVQSSPTPVNYFGLFSKNAGDCGLSFSVEVKDFETGTYVTVGNRSDFENGKPQMLSFEAINSNQQRIIINSTRKCYIAAMAIGEAVAFSRAVSVGFQPGRNASLDEVSNFTTDGNNFVQGRRLTNGYQEKAPVNYQKYSFIDGWWREFMNHVLDSKTLFFMGHTDSPENCIFGLQNPSTLTKPNYKNSHHTDIELEINGWA